MNAGDLVRTEIGLPGIPIGSRGIVREVGRVFVVVVFGEGRRGYYTARQLHVVSGPNGGRPAPDVALGIGGAQVPRGSHLCLLPSSAHAAVDAISSYVAAGVQTGDMVVCALPPRWSQKLLRDLPRLGVDGRAAVHKGKLRCVSLPLIYLSRARFTASGQLELHTGRFCQFLRTNPGGLRCLGVVADQHLASGWWEYEDRMTPLLRHLGVTALCVYWGRRIDGTARHRAVRCHTHVLEDDVLTGGGSAVL
jgi:hypothetical protein